MPDSPEDEASRDDHDGLQSTGRRGPRRMGSYDSWTVPELRERARELGMTGYSSLSKSDLIFEMRKN